MTVHTHTCTASSRVVINYFVGAFRNYFKHPTYAPTSIQGIEIHKELKKTKQIVKQKSQKIRGTELQKKLKLLNILLQLSSLNFLYVDFLFFLLSFFSLCHCFSYINRETMTTRKIKCQHTENLGNWVAKEFKSFNFFCKSVPWIFWLFCLTICFFFLIACEIIFLELKWVHMSGAWNNS